MFGMGAPIGPPEDIMENLPVGTSRMAAMRAWVTAHNRGYEGEPHQELVENPDLQEVYDHGYGHGVKSRTVDDEMNITPEQEQTSPDGREPYPSWRLRIYAEENIEFFFDSKPDMFGEDGLFNYRGQRAGLEVEIDVVMENVLVVRLEMLEDPSRNSA